MNMAAMQGHTAPLMQRLKSGGIHDLLENKCLQFPVSADLWRPIIASLVSGMKCITEDPTFRTTFPWHQHIIDAYGEKYEQEAGLDHNTRDGENKNVFQYIEGARCELGVMGSLAYNKIVVPPACIDFLKALDKTSKLAKEIALVVGHHLDEHFGAEAPYAGSMCYRILNGTIVIRGLRYRAGQSSIFDANPHIDRGLITIHLYATHEGLWIILPNGKRVRIAECGSEMLCVFFGRKYIAATRDLGNGSLHGVKYVRGPDDEDRMSFVIFVHPNPIAGDVAFLRENNAAIKALQEGIRL